MMCDRSHGTDAARLPRRLGEMPAVDFRQLNRNDQGVLVAGIVAVIATFLPYWGVDVHGYGSGSITSWHGWAFLGSLLILLATIISAVRVFGGTSLPRLPLAPNLA